MERIITLSELRKAVDEAYEENKSINEGEIDPRVASADPKSFGITLTLADGTTINKGDTSVMSPLGSISRIPIATILLSQNSPEQLIKKSGHCPCQSSHKDVKIPFSHRGIRAISAIEPVGDPDSKWNLIADSLINLMGSDPALDDKLYESEKKNAIDEQIENTLAKDGFFLYDDAAASIDLFLRAEAMTASTEQLAMMGATIAADGVNPTTQQICFDGAVSERIVAILASKGPHKMTLPWNIAAGLPAKSSFGGAIVGIYPGLLSIAAYSPALNPKGVSVKAAKAIISIMNKLQLSVFQSASIVVDKEK